MPELEKAFLLIEGGDRVPCLFNPETITFGRSNVWGAHPMPGRGVPQLRYAGADAGWMHLDLVFDTTDDGSAVTAHTDKILALMEVDPNLPGTDDNANNARPPTVTFRWGRQESFEAVVADLSLSYTYFSSSGVPLRAHMSLDLRQFRPARTYGPQNPTSGTPRPHRVHRVQPGETLDRISARYYGDSTRWRLLAVANGIEDPLTISPGSVLSVPRLEQT
jgi:hypothetical protein